jgi:hypothetical protein
MGILGEQVRRKAYTETRSLIGWFDTRLIMEFSWLAVWKSAENGIGQELV